MEGVKFMIRETSEFQADNKKREILPDNFEDFPFLCWTRDLADQEHYIGRCIPWHWHTSLELDYVFDGEVEIRTISETFHAKKGEIFFINSEVLHEIQFQKGTKTCRLCAQLFDMHFLSGMYNSLLEQKYLLPIIRNKALPVFIVRPDNYNCVQIIAKFFEMQKLCQEEKNGFEFEIRTELSDLWMLLIEETKAVRMIQSDDYNSDAGRLKVMIQFISEHYNEKITADDIAAEAKISSRECNRCFNRCIHKAPGVYLNEYRLRAAAGMLLQTDENILTISENCGFHSGSYFGKAFREYFGCTPREYRKEHSIQIR